MASEQSEAAQARETEASASPPGPATLHIFIVEDDRDLAQLFTTWIQRHYGDGATVHVEHTVADSKAALDGLPALDIALLDRRLPDGTGDELLEAIDERFDAITVMVTAVSPEVDIIRHPIDDYLMKPVEEETVVRRLSLLEKLKAANALQQYSDARKATLLEYYLDDPEQSPLYRRFAARWDYDRLEIAQYDGHVVVYELYLGDGNRDGEVHVAIAGRLGAGLAELLGAGEVQAVGELVQTGDGDYAWLNHDGDDVIDTSDGTIGIYQFTCELPEQYVSELDPVSGDLTHVELIEILEDGFN